MMNINSISGISATFRSVHNEVVFSMLMLNLSTERLHNFSSISWLGDEFFMPLHVAYYFSEHSKIVLNIVIYIPSSHEIDEKCRPFDDKLSRGFEKTTSLWTLPKFIWNYWNLPVVINNISRKVPITPDGICCVYFGIGQLSSKFKTISSWCRNGGWFKICVSTSCLQ